MQSTRREFIIRSIGGSILLTGCRPAAPPGVDDGGEGGNFRLGLVYFAPEEGADSCIAGLYEGLAQQGFERGVNLEVASAHAQGEIATIPLILQNFDSQNLDLIVTMTTPCLTAAAGIVRRTPVVFTYVYDPIAAGAGASREEHLPNITGVGSFPPVEETIDLIQAIVPNLTGVGTVYNSSEANSVKVVGVAREIFERRNIRLEEVTATSTSEVFQAAQVVSYRDVQALWVTGDNTALQSFDAIVRASRDAKIPLVINDPEFTPRGAVASVGLGWREAGRAGGVLAARVLRGEDPRDLPFEEVAVKRVVLNEAAARELGIVFPADVIAEAEA